MRPDNPWLQIPADDYEKHMSSPNVAQLQLLSEIFANVIEEYSPDSICVLGCTAGYGFEKLIDRSFEKVVGIDINLSYLAKCRNWFIEDVQNLNLICADLNELELADSSFELIYAALIFEYVEIDKLLPKIFNWLKPNGVLNVVLQLPGKASSPVSDTECESIKLLSSIMKLVPVDEFNKTAIRCGLIEVISYVHKIFNGKSFYVGLYSKKSDTSLYIKKGIPL
jgi:ubiquinone/menaquinone biosynthesis C-methylase UbiE